MMTTYLRSKEIQDLKDPRPKIQSHYLHFEVPLWAIDSTLTESPLIPKIDMFVKSWI